MGSRDHSGSGFMIGAILGGIIGGGLALVFAPKNGKQMRKHIAKSYREISNNAEDFVCMVGDQAKDIAQQAKDFAERTRDAASCFIDDIKN